ncbi:DUF4181 domain-containing protein [Gracilibacillus sp. YIM 98692]|uniref:DUF4181 domain-containing protein n=1 Tax=Gracilibacillus sp. YIM 98692 TaxID=2663532 RepID=UPI0013D3756B|nr:DUF4181 domain-containing protein [Gracilibacillus sp. YIM 98692]
MFFLLVSITVIIWYIINHWMKKKLQLERNKQLLHDDLRLRNFFIIFSIGYICFILYTSYLDFFIGFPFLYAIFHTLHMVEKYKQKDLRHLFHLLDVVLWVSLGTEAYFFYGISS